ncbi:hypothetical protein Maes01_00772 [Microbulbifer aestuariivivens]|uniref:DUF11 domain-containing protein n=1 Tax=Microbulbifer aestuariivivens TaxID=1908308 RepID=A0ABP9WNN1_9GAMM
MISYNKNRSLLAAAAGLAMLGLTSPALADLGDDYSTQTAADTTVTNTASATFTVGGGSSQSVDSNDYEFQVDRVVNMTLTEDGSSPVDTTPEATGVATKYTLTNLSNDMLDFGLGALNVTNSTALENSLGTDNLDASGIQIFLDTNDAANTGSPDGNYDSNDTLVTTVDDLAAGDSAVLFVVITVPARASDGTGADSGDIIGVELTATAKASDGTDLTETDAANTDALETVFDNSLDENTSGNPIVTVQGAYIITDADMSIVKSSTVLDDPINGAASASVFPKAIPGATVEYCMVVENTGDATAETVTLTDAIPAETTFVTSSIATGTGDTCGTNADDPVKGSESSGTITVNFGDVTAGNSVWATFEVTIN